MSERETNQYAYFFTRQDLSPEQQIVQTAHAALVLGARHNNGGLMDVQVPKNVLSDGKVHARFHVDPAETYFTVVGVRNEEALHAVQEILEKFGFEYEMFIEPDLDPENGGQATSIAVVPVDEDDRGVLLAFNLLRVGSRG